jgi:hypothetical protein
MSLSPAELDAFAGRFAACTLTRSEWTHLAHLTVGAWYVTHYGAAEALARLRVGIRRLNESFGGVNSSASGYHETITRAYLTLLDQFLAASPAELSLAERVDRLSRSPLSDRQALLGFYRRDTLMSVAARVAWVAPDLHPLRLVIE